MADLKKAMVIPDLFNVKGLIEQRSWETIREGVSISKLYEEGDTGPVAAYLHYEPGAVVPQHKHLGYEHIIILAGSQRDQVALYRRGAMVIQPPGSQHQVVSDDGCIALAIWEKPVAFV